MIRHIVLLKFKIECTEDDISLVEKAFVNLKNQIDAVRDFEWGLNNSPENFNDGFTHCFMVTFNDENDRQVYLPHPAHLAFSKLLGEHIEKGIVFDYSV